MKLLPRSISAAFAGVIIFTVVGCGVGTGGSMPSKQEINDDYVSQVDAIIQTSGLNFPEWDKNQPQGIGVAPCSKDDKSKGNYYTLSLMGSAADDPLAVAEKVRTFWESKGWEITTWDTRELDQEFPSVTVSTVSPEGIRFQFTPIKNAQGITTYNNGLPKSEYDWSQLKAQSDCSTEIK